MIKEDDDDKIIVADWIKKLDDKALIDLILCASYQLRKIYQGDIDKVKDFYDKK